MAEYENKPFLVGHYMHNEVESMHTGYSKWQSATNFFANNPRTPIYGYAAVSRPGKVYIIGGCCDHDKTISIFEQFEWRHLDNQLTQSRINFMTITYGTDIMIIGGTTESEKSYVSFLSIQK